MAILDDTRADWNARPPLRALTRVPWSERVGLSWHWIGPGKGPSAAGSHQRCLDQVRDWQAQHQDPNGRIRGKDIGYNVLICQHARAIEGRGIEYAGAHSPGVNWEHVGVQFMVGEDTPGGVTPAMYARAVKLRAAIGALGKNIRRDWGHRDDPKVSTECPGNSIYKWVHSGGPTTNTPQEDELMSVTVKNPATGKEWPIEDALWSIWTYVLDGRNKAGEAARDAAVARALAEASAAKGTALTDAEIASIGEAVGKRIAAGFDAVLVPKEIA